MRILALALLLVCSSFYAFAGTENALVQSVVEIKASENNQETSLKGKEEKRLGHVSIISAFIAAISAIVAVISLYQSKKTSLRQNFNAALQANVGLMSDIKKSIITTPEILRFHGICKEELDNAGVSIEEFVYLLNSFNAGLAFYAPTEFGELKPFSSGSIRYKMCEEDSVQKVWPLLKKMMNEGQYRDKIDLTINTINRNRESVNSD